MGLDHSLPEVDEQVRLPGGRPHVSVSHLCLQNDQERPSPFPFAVEQNPTGYKCHHESERGACQGTADWLAE